MLGDKEWKDLVGHVLTRAVVNGRIGAEAATAIAEGSVCVQVIVMPVSLAHPTVVLEVVL